MSTTPDKSGDGRDNPRVVPTTFILSIPVAFKQLKNKLLYLSGFSLILLYGYLNTLIVFYLAKANSFRSLLTVH